MNENPLLINPSGPEANYQQSSDPSIRQAFIKYLICGREFSVFWVYKGKSKIVLDLKEFIFYWGRQYLHKKLFLPPCRV